MDQPLLWSALLGVVVLGGLIRLLSRGAVLAPRAVPLRPWERVLVIIGGVLLIFHCSAMFFGPWVDAVPGLEPAARAVRAGGPASQIAYWVPAAAIVVGWRRVWWPALAGVAVTLIGVGATMFIPFPLVVHLVWLSALILSALSVSVFLVGDPRKPAVRQPSKLEQT
ncbi:hypothetical protein [Marisediminicola antarctica]|uniref:Uncharacterized protein n=1 Tax=Marisediminicola antarctica TaxID=674079 RepID=A0A7L5AKP9_9MICO|nr:hypothetical protein [Marisediminicola antarctica]QHO70652.1 hypothetical protein BHD05_14350 [Marisediminicola antarctica]